MCVLTGIPPWDLKVIERKELFVWEREIFKEGKDDWMRGHEREGDGEANQGAMADRETQEGGPEDLDAHMLPDLKEFRYDEEEEEEGLSVEDRKDRVKKALRKWLKRKAKQRTLKRWQGVWDKATVGRWTHELIPDVRQWVKKGFDRARSFQYF